MLRSIVLLSCILGVAANAASHETKAIRRERQMAHSHKHAVSVDEEGTIVTESDDASMSAEVAQVMKLFEQAKAKGLDSRVLVQDIQEAFRQRFDAVNEMSSKVLEVATSRNVDGAIFAKEVYRAKAQRRQGRDSPNIKMHHAMFPIQNAALLEIGAGLKEILELSTFQTTETFCFATQSGAQAQQLDGDESDMDVVNATLSDGSEISVGNHMDQTMEAGQWCCHGHVPNMSAESKCKRQSDSTDHASLPQLMVNATLRKDADEHDVQVAAEQIARMIKDADSITFVIDVRAHDKVKALLDEKSLLDRNIKIKKSEWWNHVMDFFRGFLKGFFGVLDIASKALR